MMGVDDDVLIYVGVCTLVCGGWFIAFVIWPKFSNWYSKNMGERLAKRMKWMDERDEELRQRKIRKKQRKHEAAEIRRSQIAAGIIADEPKKDVTEVALDSEWGGGLSKAAEEKEEPKEFNFEAMGLKEMMRKHCCEVDGTEYRPEVIWTEDDEEERLRAIRLGRPRTVPPVDSPHKKKKKATGKNNQQDTSDGALTIAQMAKRRILAMEHEKIQAFYKAMTKVMTAEDKKERGRKKWRAQIRHGSMGYQMDLGEHTSPTFGDLQDRIQWMRHTPFLHNYSKTGRRGERTKKSDKNYIDDMDTKSALSLQSPMPKRASRGLDGEDDSMV